jgi:Spy/CpxP family protein refolding chaperone
LKSNHHHGSDSSSQSNPLSQLDLTSAQQTQIGQIVSAAQADGTSPSDELNQIDNVLTPTQQQQLVSLFAGDASSSTSTASGNVISTTA